MSELSSNVVDGPLLLRTYRTVNVKLAHATLSEAIPIFLKEEQVTEQATHNLITVDFEEPLSDGWKKVPGVTIDGTTVTIDPEQYFFRYENASWKVCDWEGVKNNVLNAAETADEALEQQTLQYVRDNAKSTKDAAIVLKTAEQLYSYIFRDEHLDDPDIKSMGVTREHLRMLREMGTMMALNRVELDGHISNVGPAWFFPVCSGKVYNLDQEQMEFIDELYHGTFFNESRRVESVKAHAALGGRLVHGCHSSPCMAGGSVVPFGTDIASFSEELKGFKEEWMDVIRAF